MNIYALKGHKVESWYTHVWLQEFPDVKFNSTCFEDVTEQPEDKNKLHPDFEKYN